MILILTQCFPPDLGGIENLMGGLAAALRAEALPVHVLADKARLRGPRTNLPEDGIERFSGPRPVRRWLKMRRAKALLDAGTVTAVFADSYKSIEDLPPTSVPVIVLAHGMEFPPAPSARKVRRIKTAFAKATTVIANSHFTAGLIEAYLAPGRSPVVINPPIAPQPEATAAARTRLAALIAGRGPVIVTLSRLEPRKGIDQVIRALPFLVKNHPGLVYLVAGGGEDEARLKALASQCGVAAQVDFLGRVDDDMKAALFEQAALFAMPVRREGASVEGFGISYCEAAWYGVPALAGCEGGAVDAVLDGVTGLVCDGAQPDRVTEQLSRLLDDADLRLRLGQAACQRARGPLQWSQAIKTYLALIGPGAKGG